MKKQIVYLLIVVAFIAIQIVIVITVPQSNVYISGLFAIFGVVLGSLINYLSSEKSIENQIRISEAANQNQLRVAVLDKRIVAHQTALTLANRIEATFRSCIGDRTHYQANSVKLQEYREECNNFLLDNHFYLQDEIRDALNNAIKIAHIGTKYYYPEGTAPTREDSEDLKKDIDELGKIIDVIKKAFSLPPINI